MASSSSPPSTSSPPRPSSSTPSSSLARLHALLTSRYGPLVSVHSSRGVRESLASSSGLSPAQLLAPAGERVQLNGTLIDLIFSFQCLSRSP